MFALSVLASADARAVTCIEYSGITALPNHMLGTCRDYSVIDIQTKGNYAYLFDCGQLDCINVEDPLQMVPVNYGPPIVISPDPWRLIKHGQNHLYAWHSNGVAVIDISVPSEPNLIGTTPVFGSTNSGDGRFVGEYGDYLFFVTGSRELKTYDLSDPVAPLLVSTIGLPLTDGLFLGAASGFGQVYLTFLEFSSSEFHFLIYDLTSPAVPALMAQFRPSLGNWPSDWEMVMSNSFHHVLVSGSRLWVQFDTGGLGSASTFSAAFEIDGSGIPVGVGISDDIVEQEINGITYGSDADGGMWPQKWITVGENDVPWNWQYPIHRMVLTDRAMLFTAEVLGDDKLVSAPRECDEPSIVVGSATHEISWEQSGGMSIALKWRTEGWTDCSLDRAQIRNTPIGTIDLERGSELVLCADGTWLHSIEASIPYCDAPAMYSFDVHSELTGLNSDENNRKIKILYCLQQAGPLDMSGDLTLTVAPNPFNPSTVLEFSAPAGIDHVELEIFGLDGRRIRSLSATLADGGTGNVTWSGTHDDGTPVASGVYFAKLRAGKSEVSQKLFLLK